MVGAEHLNEDYAALLAGISGNAARMSGLDSFFAESLATIGTVLGVGRVYFAALAQDGQCEAVYEWNAPGVAPQRVFAPGKACGDNCLSLELAEGRPLSLAYLRDVADPALRSLLEQQGTQSLLAVPVWQNSRVAALLGLERCNGPMMWSGGAVDLVMSIAHTFAVARCKALLSDYAERQSRYIEDILNTVPGKTYVADFDTYELLYANNEMFEAYGNDILGTKCYKTLQNLDEPCSFCSNKRILAEPGPYTWLHYSEVLKRNIQVTDRCIELPSGKLARISHNKDVTEFIQMQRDKDLAERTAQAKGDFLARMSHEIRTPMNAIIGFTHLLARTPLDEQQQDYLNKTRIAANGLLHIINDILDFSRIEAGKMNVECVPFRLAVLLAAVQSIIGFSAREKRLEFAVHVAPDVPTILCGDPGRLNQVLINLLSNAVKFTAAGHVKLNVSVLHDAGPGVVLHCEVEDTGIGMSPEQTAQLFQPFTQADGSVARRFGGTGLGLAISKRLVELMGGSIAVESEAGRGTTFSCTIRAEAGNELTDSCALFSELDKVPNSEIKERLTRIKGARVLVVDDNDINLEIARELLESIGMHVAEASGGEDAVVKISREPFDLVFMDMQMPDVDGLEATRRVREQSLRVPRIAGLPIVAMTANVLAADKQRCFDSGMNDHIAKPLNLDELTYCLLHWIPARDAGKSV